MDYRQNFRVHTHTLLRHVHPSEAPFGSKHFIEGWSRPHPTEGVRKVAYRCGHFMCLASLGIDAYAAHDPTDITPIYRKFA